jgi:hypothetical protein
MHNFGSSFSGIGCNLNAFGCHFCNNGIHLHYSIPSFTPPILIIPYLVIDVVLTKKGGAKSGTTKSAKAWA